MFKCPKCGNKLSNFVCKKCNYEIPIHNGVKYFCDDENINTEDDGHKYIGYDDINIHFSPSLVYWGLDHYDIYGANAEDIVKKYGKGIVVLDLGCGLGQATIPFAASGAITIGVDISEKMLEFAYQRSNCKYDNLHLCKMNAYNLNLEDESVDVTANFDEASLNATGTAGVAAGVGTAAYSTDSTVREVEKLDDREKVFPALSSIDAEYDGYAVEKVPTDHLSLEEIAVRFRNYLAKEEKLYFDIDTIRFFISGFSASHFMILEGLSGTGKSSLPRYFAKFINANVLFIPVQATWRDKTSLIGYFNDFAKTYAETEFLTTLYHGNYNPDMIHIYVLDEMNISRVEYYFAEMLSILEMPNKDEWIVELVSSSWPDDPKNIVDGKLKIPANVWYIGTINNDDSTFMVTDKVYDRAMPLDINDKGQVFDPIDTEAQDINFTYLDKLFSAAMADNPISEDTLNKINEMDDYVIKHFRIVAHMKKFVPVYVACGGDEVDGVDYFIARKILRKFEQLNISYIRDEIDGYIEFLDKTFGKGKMKECEEYLLRLKKLT